jgi:molybdopterin-guanine dinucleotide biosynthesis protein A
VVGGIVLAGGRSSRMGTPKASLEWHGSTLVRRVGGILERATGGGPIVIVRAAGQPLPALPAAWRIVDDARPDRGPLEALAAGLAVMTDAAFVASTDLALLHPAFVARVLAGLRPQDAICAPVTDGRSHPLAAAYRTGVTATIAELLAADELRLGGLLERCPTRRLEAADLLGDPALAAADPQLASLVNVNAPADYALARARPAPGITVVAPGTTTSAQVRAATVGQAAAAAGVAPVPGVAVTVNGARGDGDPQTPLVDGDIVGFST